MNAEKRKEFRGKYITGEMVLSVILAIAWLIYQFKHVSYGQTVTYWMCACMIAVAPMGLMIPVVVREKTKRYKKNIKLCLNNTARHMPMTMVWCLIWSIQLSSDFGTEIATVSMKGVAKLMVFGVIACPILFEALMKLMECMMLEDAKVEQQICETA